MNKNFRKLIECVDNDNKHINVDISMVNNNPVSIKNGNSDNGTQRIIIASDDFNLSAINNNISIISSKIENLSSINNNMNQNINSIKNDITTLKNDISIIKDIMNDIWDQIFHRIRVINTISVK